MKQSVRLRTIQRTRTARTCTRSRPIRASIPFLLLALLTTPAGAQSSDSGVRPPGRFENPVRAAGRFKVAPAPLVRRAAGSSFLIEFVGATAGSLVGLGLGLRIARPDECNNEDLECILRGVGVAGLTSFVGAPAGAVLLGNMAETSPSVWGAWIGSAAGVAAGAGLLKLAEEVDDDTLPVRYSLVVFSGTHGLLTALGSRIGAAIRD